MVEATALAAVTAARVRRSDEVAVSCTATKASEVRPRLMT
jgi:hypothetical protein